MERVIDKVDFLKIKYPKNLVTLNLNLINQLPKTKFAKEDELPLPKDQIHSVVRKYNNKRTFKTYENFEILTYKDLYGKNLDEDAEEIIEENYLEFLEPGITRWLIPKN